MDDKPLQALANKLKTPAQESQRKGFFRLQQVKNNQPRITGIPVNHQGPQPDIFPHATCRTGVAHTIRVSACSVSVVAFHPPVAPDA